MARTSETGAGSRSRAPRMLAPVALVAVAIIVLMVISSSVGDSSDPAEPSRGAPSGQQQSKPKKQKKAPKTYVVEPGDSLSSIAAEFEITVDELLRLNESVDPQALVTGQELKLR